VYLTIDNYKTLLIAIITINRKHDFRCLSYQSTFRTKFLRFLLFAE